MTKHFEKFIKKQSKDIRLKIEKVLEDIQKGLYNQYDLKDLKGHENTFRIRKGKIRIVFEKNQKGIKIIDIDTRGEIYKN